MPKVNITWSDLSRKFHDKNGTERQHGYRLKNCTKFGTQNFLDTSSSQLKNDRNSTTKTPTTHVSKSPSDSFILQYINQVPKKISE